MTKIWNFFTKISTAAIIFAAAYFVGKTKGKDDEKIKNLKDARKNIVRAMRARDDLNDADFVRGLRKKYRRE